ncbi:uncharacterized protein LOC115689984 isoform X3 [Syzygium oleosum]|uniref:uncharacterized protein LOC115689984 isoform X3 n=1 Tax=Syzygium oleosum TaxID=219896 RepID=UPI0024BAE498|nr:uncharacterized protein LOC115689984 isoform X3 [Syzygium oleosum]
MIGRKEAAGAVGVAVAGSVMDGDGGARSEEEEEAERRMEEEVRRAVELAKELQDAAAAHVARASSEEQSVRQRTLALDSSIRRLRAAVGAHASGGLLDSKLAERLEEELQRARCIVADGDASSFLPSKAQGGFVRMFLGPINVRALRKEVQLKVKEEYNSYRDRTALLFLIFPSALLVLRSWLWDGCFPTFPVQLYQAWLLFLYTGLALRENILSINGSDIRPWWIYHHYCAMIMALVSLTWEIKGQPNCAQKQRGVQLFLQWAIMQGVAMLLQNRYQRQRLYTRIALGKAKRMDVVWGETAGVDGQLWLLCPILFIMQVIFCGILLVLMAVGNFANTIQTLMAKSRFKAKMKRTKSKQELD